MLQKLRRIALYRQGLASLRPFGTGLPATQRALEHLRYIQIDTLSVVQRAHHHTLWNRNPDYQPEHLDKLVQQRVAFEHWAHAAAYLPMCDYRFALPKMSAIRQGESPYYQSADSKCVREVYDRIRIEGPLKARDFESPEQKNGVWWDWKPTKKALEKLFMQGDLMITRRDGMQKVYDLTERVLPAETNTREPTLEEFAEYLIDTAVNTRGFTTTKQITYLRPGRVLRDAVQTVLQQKMEMQQLTVFSIDGLPDIYAPPDLFDQKTRISASNVRLLSPFDNAIIHRDNTQRVFDFDYKLECYLPKQKRRFGYFCLPVLYQDRIVGRVDCKAHRQTREFELIHFHLENPLSDLDCFAERFAKAVHRFAVFNDCDQVKMTSVSPQKLLPLFRRAFSDSAALT